MYDTLFFIHPVVDMIVPLSETLPVRADNTYLIKTIKLEPGGPANIVIASKRVGLNILPIGIVGDDYYGGYLLDEYKKEGLDVSQLTVVPGFETPKVIILVDTDGNHSFISMIEGMIDSFKNVEKLIKKARSICFSGYYVVTEADRADSMNILRLARAAGILVFFDPGPLVSAIPPSCMDEILETSTVTILNAKEATLLSKIEEVERSAEWVLNKTPGIVVVKSGSQGCYIMSHNDKRGRWYEGFKVKLVDTTAAGDSFWGAFMFGYLSGWDIETIAYFSNAVGAAKVEKLGSGSQVPKFDEIVNVLERGGFNIPGNIKRNMNFNNLVLHRK
jgi:ribokinase